MTIIVAISTMCPGGSGDRVASVSPRSILAKSLAVVGHNEYLALWVQNKHVPLILLYISSAYTCRHKPHKKHVGAIH